MRAIFFIFLMAAFLTPASATMTCDECIATVEQLSKTENLTPAERGYIGILISKARREQDQERQQNCKFIVDRALRYLIIKKVLD